MAQFEIEEKIEALRNYLNEYESASVDEDTEYTQSDWDDNVISINDGREYYVLDEDEAQEYAERSVRSFLDELGIQGFSDSFRQWIYDNAIDSDWFEEAMEESNTYYVDDIKDEYDDEFGTRLIREAYDEGILSDDDFEQNDDGTYDYTQISEYVDLDDIAVQYVDALNGRESDPIQWYIDNFGLAEFSDVVRNNPSLVDEDMVIEEVIDQDGYAQLLAAYDGDEIDLGGGLYAYRYN